MNGMNRRAMKLDPLSATRNGVRSSGPQRPSASGGAMVRASTAVELIGGRYQDAKPKGVWSEGRVLILREYRATQKQPQS